MKKLVACFVNSEEHPKKISHHGFFKTYDKRVFELCTKTYPHPDAPEDAIVTILDWVEVTVASSSVAAFKQMEEAMASLKNLVL